MHCNNSSGGSRNSVWGTNSIFTYPPLLCSHQSEQKYTFYRFEKQSVSRLRGHGSLGPPRSIARQHCNLFLPNSLQCLFCIQLFHIPFGTSVFAPAVDINHSPDIYLASNEANCIICIFTPKLWFWGTCHILWWLGNWIQLGTLKWAPLGSLILIT